MQKVVSLPYDAVLAKLPEALKAEGFRALTQIDVRDTLRESSGSSSVATRSWAPAIRRSHIASAAWRPIAEEVRGKLARVLERLP